ncbi:MAG: hypothetical protein RL095_1647 [Verrucomicrobiota bacterium]|jgi:hypothetical protein
MGQQLRSRSKRAARARYIERKKEGVRAAIKAAAKAKKK